MLDGKSFTAVVWLHSKAGTKREWGYSVASVSGEGIPTDLLKRLLDNEDSNKNLRDVMPLCEAYYGDAELDWWHEMKFTYTYESDGTAAVDIEHIRAMPDWKESQHA